MPYDNNRHGDHGNTGQHDVSLPALRERMGAENDHPSEAVPELQATEMGHASGSEDGKAGKGEQGYIYFIETQEGEYVKIGYSTEPMRRLGQLRSTIMPVTLRLVGTFPASRGTEVWLHRKFADQRHIGEWFHSTPEFRTFINALGLDVPEPEPEPKPKREPKPKPEPKPKWKPRPESELRMVMTTEEAGRLRWKGMTDKQKREAQRAAAKARWEKWRKENPEKATASEARRAKRAGVKKAKKVKKAGTK